MEGEIWVLKFKTTNYFEHECRVRGRSENPADSINMNHRD